MDSFVKIFQEWSGLQALETDINTYASERNLEIVSITSFSKQELTRYDGSEAVCLVVVYKKKYTESEKDNGEVQKEAY